MDWLSQRTGSCIQSVSCTSCNCWWENMFFFHSWRGESSANLIMG